MLKIENDAPWRQVNRIGFVSNHRCEMSYLEELTQLFARDPLIDEVGYLLDDVTQSFQLHSHKLGIALQIAPQLFKEGRHAFRAYKSALDVANVAEETLITLNNATRAILLISADFYSAWNTRRKLVTRSFLTLDQELRFSTVVLLFHPKSIDTWAYRRWLSARSMLELSVALTEEFALCAIISERYPRNYHSWSYRHWLWLQSIGMHGNKSGRHTLIRDEMERMDIWCKSHLMDCSGWNHRALILSSLINSEDAELLGISSRAILSKEYEFISKLLATYPEHEALWYHRRFVIQQHLRVAFCNETDPASCFETLIHDAKDILMQSMCKIQNISVAQMDLQAAWNKTRDHTAHNINKSTLQLLVEEIQTALIFSADRTDANFFAKQFAFWLLEFCASKCSRPDQVSYMVKQLRLKLMSE